MSKVLIVTGGTGGHIFPAEVVRDYVRSFCSDVKFIIGGVPKVKTHADYYFRAYPLMGTNIKEKIIFLFNSFIGILQSTIIILKEKPRVVLAFGSYASLPFLISTCITKIPFFLFEQNSIPGGTVRIFSKLSKGVFISFKQTSKYLKKRSFYVGGLIKRRKIIPREQAEENIGIKPGERKVILFMGGSQGAKRLIEVALKFSYMFDEFYVLILAGKFYDEFKDLNRYHNLRIYPFREDIENFYSVSDYVVSRAGSSTIYELIYYRRKAILVPYPYAAFDHQKINAEFARTMGIFEVVDEKNLTPEILREKIMLLDKKKGDFFKFDRTEEKIKEVLKCYLF